MDVNNINELTEELKILEAEVDSIYKKQIEPIKVKIKIVTSQIKRIGGSIRKKEAAAKIRSVNKSLR